MLSETEEKGCKEDKVKVIILCLGSEWSYNDIKAQGLEYTHNILILWNCDII